MFGVENTWIFHGVLYHDPLLLTFSWANSLWHGAEMEKKSFFDSPELPLPGRALFQTATHHTFFFFVEDGLFRPRNVYFYIFLMDTILKIVLDVISFLHIWACREIKEPADKLVHKDHGHPKHWQRMVLVFGRQSHFTTQANQWYEIITWYEI